MRHARDHFVLLMDSVSSPPPHVLSYDKRGRNTPMESSRSAARAALMEAIQQLETHVPLAQMDTPIILHAVTPDLQEFRTTFGREVGGKSLDKTMVDCYSSGLLAYIVSITGRWYEITIPYRRHLLR